MKMLNSYYENNQHLNLVIVQNLSPLTHPNFNELQLAVRPLCYRKGYYKQQPTNCVSASQLPLKDITAIPSYEDLPKENAYLPLYQNICDSHNQLSVLMSLTELIIHKVFVSDARELRCTYQYVTHSQHTLLLSYQNVFLASFLDSLFPSFLVFFFCLILNSYYFIIPEVPLL